MTVDLEFSRKYDYAHSVKYLNKHKDGVYRRLSSWRDVQLARKALKAAGEPKTILDLPCGAGRFWPMLAEKPERVLFAADNSKDMVEVALTHQPAHIANRFEAFQSSAFDIQLEREAVDCIFCMRLMHHIADSKHRVQMLKEFHRVTRDTVILSLWVDGNFKAMRRKGLEKKRGARTVENRFVISRQQIEVEFLQAGFDVVKHFDFMPLYAMWRVYVLRKN